ncbi:MAG: S1C family serine protease [Solirubrobacterales bacterium]
MSSSVGSKLFPALIGAFAACVVFAALALAGAFDDDNSPASSGRAVPTQTAASPSGGLDVAGLYENTRSGVVFVEARGQGPGQASGSGFLVDGNGSILTNQHVVDDAEEVDVRFGEDGDPVDAKVTGTDPSTDLALLKIDPGDADGRPLRLGSSSQVRVGEPVIAIGSPFGLRGTVTSGIVSGLGREIQSPNGFTIDEVVQTDAAINPGNSGGPLIDERGRVIGVNAQIASSGTRSNSGVGFAIPIDTAKEVIPELRKSGEVKRAYLGVSSADVESAVARQLNLPTDRGALVQSVVRGGPADDAGLRGGQRRTDSGLSAGGDLIVKVGDREISDPSELADVISALKPGEQVRVEYFRGDERRSAQVKLGERPDQANQG